jgi:elongation factor 1-alpha
MSKVKPDINVVILGHVNSGRSTSIGHLIYKCTAIDKKILDELEKESIKVSHLSNPFVLVFNEKIMTRYCSYI